MLGDDVVGAIGLGYHGHVRPVARFHQVDRAQATLQLRQDARDHQVAP